MARKTLTDTEKETKNTKTKVAKKPTKPKETSVEVQEVKENKAQNGFLQCLYDADEIVKERTGEEVTPITIAIRRILNITESDPERIPYFQKHEHYWRQVWESNTDITQKVNTIVFHIVELTK